MLIKNVFDVIISPHYSEKATMQAELSKFTFKVAKNATKKSIKEAIKKLFSIDAISVNIINKDSKEKVFKGKIGRRPGFKKAIVTLPKGKVMEYNIGS